MSDPLYARFGRQFCAGEVLFREGESGVEMFVIHSGAVQISKRAGSQDRPIATLGRGEFLGEMALLNDKPRTATATVIEDARCLVIDAKMLETMVAKNSEIALRLIKKLAHRLDAANEMIQMLLHPDPRARVLLGLKRRAETFGEATAGGVRVRAEGGELAAEAGVREEDVRDVLTRLRRLRIAAPDEGEHVVIADVGRLLEFLEFLENPKKLEGG